MFMVTVADRRHRNDGDGYIDSNIFSRCSNIKTKYTLIIIITSIAHTYFETTLRDASIDKGID